MSPFPENVAEWLLPTVREAIGIIRSAMSANEGFDIIRRVGSTPSRALDYRIEAHYLEAISARLPHAAVLTEESGWVGDRRDAKFIVLLDPIDGTEVAARGVALCSTAISIVRPSGELVASAVGDVGLERVFWAIGSESYVENRPLRAGPSRELDEILLVEYSFGRRPQTPIIWPNSFPGYYLSYGGPLLVAKLADGSIDVVVEHQRGYPSYDLIPGYHIATNCGASFRDLDGRPLAFGDWMSRYKFVAASSDVLLTTLLPMLDSYMR